MIRTESVRVRDIKMQPQPVTRTETISVPGHLLLKKSRFIESTEDPKPCCSKAVRVEVSRSRMWRAVSMMLSKGGSVNVQSLARSFAKLVFGAFQLGSMTRTEGLTVRVMTRTERSPVGLIRTRPELVCFFSVERACIKLDVFL
jgi:hypothetical protein